MGNIDWSALINQEIGKIFDLVFRGIGGFFAAWLAYRYSIKSDLNKIKAELNQNITKDQIAKIKSWTSCGKVHEDVNGKGVNSNCDV